MSNVFPAKAGRDMYPHPVVDREGVEWSEYVRKVEFVDVDPVGPKDPPAHVLRRVLFDGAIAPVTIHQDGITVDLSTREATVVTMWVHEDDVQIGHLDDDGYAPWLIGGRRVLTPVGEGWDWEPVDVEPESAYYGYVVCSFFVAEVHVR